MARDECLWGRPLADRMDGKTLLCGTGEMFTNWPTRCSFRCQEKIEERT
jgi:hypothetical protein